MFLSIDEMSPFHGRLKTLVRVRRGDTSWRVMVLPKSHTSKRPFLDQPSLLEVESRIACGVQPIIVAMVYHDYCTWIKLQGRNAVTLVAGFRWL